MEPALTVLVRIRMLIGFNISLIEMMIQYRDFIFMLECEYTSENSFCSSSKTKQWVFSHLYTLEGKIWIIPKF